MSEIKSGNEISFSAEKIYASSDIFKSCIEIFLSEFENIKMTLMHTEEYWEGMSYESFMGVRDDFCSEIEEFAAELETYDDKLRIIADTYRETEEKNLEEVSRLPDNIIE